MNEAKQVSISPGDFVPQGFARNDRDLFANPFVGVKIKGKSWVVFLNDYPRCLLHGLSTDTTLEI